MEDIRQFSDEIIKTVEEIKETRKLLEELKKGLSSELESSKSSDYKNKLDTILNNISGDMKYIDDTIASYLSEFKARSAYLDTLKKDFLEGTSSFSTSEIQEINENVINVQKQRLEDLVEFGKQEKEMLERRKTEKEELDQIVSKNKEILEAEKERAEAEKEITNEQEEQNKNLKEQKGNQKDVSNVEDDRLDTNRDITKEQQKQSDEIKKQKEAEKEYEAQVANAWNTTKSMLSSAWGHIKRGGQMWLQFNEKAVADVKRLGATTREEAVGYTKYLLTSSQELARDFGLRAEQAMKLNESYIKATGRATILSRSQMSDVVATSKLMGEETVQSAMKIMDNMGSTSQTTVELLDRTYARAKNAGLDIARSGELLVQNLSLANRLNFRGGVDGISKMVIHSQRIRMNLQEVSNVAEKFSTIEGAIEGAARIQMLGGVGALYGSNPMQMMYEALSDPEALFERMGNMFSQQAVFNRRTGAAEIDPVQMQIIREQARAMGMNPDEAVQSAKQQAKRREIESDFARMRPGVFASATQEQRDALANKAEYDVETGSWKVTYFNEEKGADETADINTITVQQLEKITKDNIDPVKDIRKNVASIAHELIGTKEQVASMKDQNTMGIAKQEHGFMKFADKIISGINDSPVWKALTTTMWGAASMIVAGMAFKGIGMLLSGKIAQYGGRLALGLGSLFGFKGAPKPTAKGGPETINEFTKSPEGIRAGGNSLGQLSSRVGVASRAFRSGLKWGTGFGIISGGLEAYQGWNEASSKYNEELERTRRITQSGYNVNGRHYSESEVRAREVRARNERNVKRGEAIGGGVGTAAGMGVGTAIGSAIGSFIPIPGGTLIGGLIGGWIGGKFGKKTGKDIGRGFAPEDAEADLIGKHLSEISKSDEKENLRRIILPVESIDYNVSLIANQLGIKSAMPSRDNIYLHSEEAGERKVEFGEVFGGEVGIESGGIASGSGTPYRPTGSITLNVEGLGVAIGNAIEGNMGVHFESIDKNVSLITSAVNGGVSPSNVASDSVGVVEAKPFVASRVNNVDTQIINASDIYGKNGFDLNVNGAIDLNLKGNNITQITADDIKLAFERNPELQRQLVEMIVDRFAINVNGKSGTYDNLAQRLGGPTVFMSSGSGYGIGG